MYDGLSANLTRVSSPIDFKSHGLRAGAEGRWVLPFGWSLFGQFSTSLLVGEFESRLVETDDNGASLNVDVRDNFTQLVPVLELILGARWENNTWYASAGYELVNWANMVDSPDFFDDVASGKTAFRTSDLSLDGFFVRVGRGW